MNLPQIYYFHFWYIKEISGGVGQETWLENNRVTSSPPPPSLGIIEVQVSEVTSVWFNGTM